MKTLDLQAREWFDKINGNSYFAAIVTLDYGMDTAKTIKIPFQYGYDSYFEEAAGNKLIELGEIKKENLTTLSRYCRENGIILRSSIQRNCKKRDVKSFIS